MEVLFERTFWIIALGTGLLGATSGILGSFAVLRNQSLLGDAISHAALPGIVLAYLLTGEKSSFVLLSGAIVCGILGSYFVNDIVKNSRLKTDTALGIILSVFFGIGMMLLTYAQSLDDANQAGLDKYLFGQASTLMQKDVLLMLGFLIPSLLLVFTFWKEIKIFLFDAEYAQTLDIPVRKINLMLTLLIVIIIVMGLQTVGVVLMSSLLLAPAAAARQWTNSLSKMLGIAAIIGAFSGVFGSYISATESNLPTGPVVVLIVSVIVFISLLFAPQRGLIAKYLANKEKQKQYTK
ncbi:metal ABC transporter permease [Weeksellaceae bacterium KMM 9713]|uniref:Metal ABC transporter permease n=1 Tax=Profundicola chukchiensis TaxID=2961959 RepID=A0A9X4RXS3_9FLAO|nr:iron chelate uptake ABC transporter family permease subunit [Profundicola chukchiensis]MDG4946979.1 metal ABC transporter permease [Profundicola chukchiensis]